MLKRLTFTLTVTASLTGVYWIYALVVTPRLAPKILTAQQRPHETPDELKFEPPPSNIRNAEQFLPDSPWAKTAKFQIAMASGVLYSESWRLKDESQNLYEFRPFAMVWFDTPEAGASNDDSIDEKPPMTLISDAGLVQFSSKFDPINRKYGRVIGAKLEGDVIAGGPDGLTIRGRDFFFHEQSLELHSDSPVQFTYQSHRGKADRGFKADLVPSSEIPRPDEFLGISGFRRMTLRGQVEMDLSNQDSPLHITCDEVFQFNPEQWVAWFQGNVNVQRFMSNVQPDQLKCQNLDLIFENELAQNDVNTPRARGDAPAIMPILRGNRHPKNSMREQSDGHFDQQDAMQTSVATSDRLTLRELRATGPRVELNSPSNGLTAIGTAFLYEPASRTAKLAAVPMGRKTNGVELKSVFVKHQSSFTELNCPKLELTHDENGQVISAHGYGPGRFRRTLPDSEQIELSAKWQDRFDLQQVPDQEIDLLTFIGSAVLQQPLRESGIKAEQIQFWFARPSGTPVKKHAETMARQTVTLPSANVTTNDFAAHSVPNLATSGFRPRQLQAQDQVIVVSPQMKAETQRFIVNFDDHSPAPGELVDESNSRSGIHQASDRSTSTEENYPAKSPTEPIQLRADFIRANVRLAGNSQSKTPSARSQPELTEVWTEGHVDIQQPGEGDSEALRLIGERLHLRNASREGQQVLHVFGQPAMIRARGFDIEGNEIYLDRPNNRTWIEGAGELRLPVTNDPLDGQKLESPTLLTVWWKEKMLFDGQTAIFLDDVKAVLKNSRLQCQEMEVVLNEKLSFRDNSGTAPTAEVQRVICKDGVEVDHTTYVDDNLTEIRHGDFATLTLDQTSGRMEAVGPGRIDLWRPGRGKRAALAPRAVTQANRPLESEISQWEFTRVTFQGKTIGNLRGRHTKFQDRVQITYGPVSHPPDTINPDHLPKDGGAMECDVLQILQVNSTGSQKPHIELEAKGNAKLEGRTFNARADEITFDESKELYTLRATGNRQATIWRQSDASGERNEASAKTWRFIPSTNYLKADQTTGIRGTN